MIFLIKNIPVNNNGNLDINLVSNKIEKIIVETIKEQNPDINEYMRNEIGKDSDHYLKSKTIDVNETINTILSKPKLVQSIFNPKALVRKAYLYVDSRYRNRNYPNNIFNWNIASSGTNYDKTTSIICTSKIRNIIAVTMTPFKFPNSSGVLSNLNRIYVNIVELQNQAYVTSENIRFHFEFDVQYTNQLTAAEATGYRIQYTNNNPNETSTAYTHFLCNDIGNSIARFEFVNPIAELNTLTLQFYNGLNYITLDNDIAIGTVLECTETFLTFTFNKEVYIALYDKVIINDISINNSTSQQKEFTNDLNRSEGWQISKIINSNPVSYSIYYSGGLSVDPANFNNGQFTIYLQSKRIITKIEVEYIDMNENN